MQFTPTESFYDADLRSEYVAGLTYTVRPRKPDPKIKDDAGTPLEETLLFAKVQRWLAEGKVALGPAKSTNAETGAADARLSGTGTVT